MGGERGEMRERQGNILTRSGAVQLAVNIPGSAHNERAWVVQVARIVRIDLYLGRDRGRGRRSR